MGTRGNHHYVLEVSERKSSKMVIPPHVAVEEGGGTRAGITQYFVFFRGYKSSNLVIPTVSVEREGGSRVGITILPINPPTW